MATPPKAAGSKPPPAGSTGSADPDVDPETGTANSAKNGAKLEPPTPTDPRLDQINNIDTIPDHLPLVVVRPKGKDLPDGQWNIHVQQNLKAAAMQCVSLAELHQQTAAAISSMFFLLSIVEILASAISTSVSFASWSRTAAGVLSAITTIVGTITAAYKFNELAARHRAASFKFMELYNTINNQHNRKLRDRYNGPLLAEWVATVMVHLRSVCPIAWPRWLLCVITCSSINVVEITGSDETFSRPRPVTGKETYNPEMPPPDDDHSAPSGAATGAGSSGGTAAGAPPAAKPTPSGPPQPGSASEITPRDMPVTKDVAQPRDQQALAEMTSYHSNPGIIGDAPSGNWEIKQ